MEDRTRAISVVIGALQKCIQSPTKTYTEKIELLNEATLDELWKKLREKGYYPPDEVIDCMGREWNDLQVIPCFHPYQEVEVVSNEVSVDANKIHIDESLVAFTNRGIKPSFRLEDDSESSSNSIRISTQSNMLVIEKYVKIRFHRTVRMPDDGRVHHLPGSLGLLPLYNASAYTTRLPGHVSERKGIFLPILSREATWMSFHALEHKCALRVFAGGVNAVTGKTAEVKTIDQGENGVQDYLVIPGQPWLDGINIQEGVVRQFVAMPLGSGYTIESQKTGTERYGGLQIEIIPEYYKGLRKWLRDDLTADCMAAIKDGDKNFFLSEFKTPLQLGLQPGDRIRSYPPELIFWRSVKIADFIDFGRMSVDLRAAYADLGYQDNYLEGPSDDSDLLSPSDLGYESELLGLAPGTKLIQDIYRDYNSPETWNTAASRVINVHFLDPATCESITHIVPPPPPIDATEYLRSNLPFFAVEENVENRLHGGDFENVKSVAAIDRERGISTESTFDPNKPTQCSECMIRLCDCIVRPCDHTFCNMCIKKIENENDSTESWQCPKCHQNVSHVAGFSGPMNLPGEESLRVNVPVSVLKVEDGRATFQSMRATRI